MKRCPKCQAALPDDAETCSLCGESVKDIPVETEEQAEVSTAEVMETLSNKKKKTPVGLIVGIVAAVVLIVAIVIAATTSRKEEAPAAPGETVVPSEESVAPSEQEPAAQPETEPAEKPEPKPAHHVNAYGLPSYSIHFARDGDSIAYQIRNEKGELEELAEDSVREMMDRQIAACGDQVLTNNQMMFYFDQQFYIFASQYGQYLSYLMDPSKPLDEQVGMNGVDSWQSDFVGAGLDMFHQVAAIYNEAMANGFTLPEEGASRLDTMEAQLEDVAVQSGFESAEAYLQDYYGPTATMENYLEFFRLTELSAAYTQDREAQTEVTEDDVDAYYEENAEQMASMGLVQSDKPNVNVRHILIQPESTTGEDGQPVISEEAWKAAEEQANELYAQWQSGDATEDSFAALATENTQDPGSQQTGGLYEDVFPGQMVPEFNDWCFADGRKTGDSGVVKTDYGYHIMFFVSQGEEIHWRTQVRQMAKVARVNDWIMELKEKYPMTAEQSQVIIMDAKAPTVPAPEMESAQEAVPETDGE